MLLFRILLLAFIATSNQLAYADDFIENSIDEINFSGFGTIAATKAGNDSLGYYPDYSVHPQTGDWSLGTGSTLGAQIDWTINSQLKANFQVVLKDRANDSFNESLKWANLKYKPVDDVALRGGRLGVDIYMLSEYRDVGFAYLWARPMPEFYQPAIFSHFDGLDLELSKKLNDSFIKIKLFAGETETSVSDGISHNEMKFEGLYGGSIWLENQKWKGRIGYLKTKLVDQPDPLPTLSPVLEGIPSIAWPEIESIRKKLEYTNKDFSYISAGIAYEDDWVIHSEVAYLESEWEYFPSSYSGYISIGKRFNELTPYIVLSHIETEDDAYQVNAPPAFSALEPVLQGIFNQVQYGQQTLSLGLRWDFNPQAALKLQWDHTKILDGKTALWAQYQYPSNESSMDTFSISLDFLF